MSVVPELKTLVGLGKTGQAITGLLQLTEQLGDTDLHNQALLLSGQFRSLEAERAKMLLDPQTDNRRSAKVNQSLLYILDQIPDATPGKLTYVKDDGEEVEVVKSAAQVQKAEGSGHILIQDVSGGTINVNVHHNAPPEKP